MRRFPILLLCILAGAVCTVALVLSLSWPRPLLGAATTNIYATMAREVIAAGAGSSTEDYITSQTTVEYAWPSGTEWQHMHTVTVANGTGAFLYLRFFNSDTTATLSNTADFDTMLKTSETLVISLYGENRAWMPINKVCVYQRQLTAGGADPSSYTLQIKGYR